MKASVGAIVRQIHRATENALGTNYDIIGVLRSFIVYTYD